MRGLALSLLLLVVGLGPGCGGIRHATAALKDQVPQKVPAVHAATLAVLRADQVDIVKESADGYEGRVDGTRPDGTTVSVLYERQLGQTTEISILIGAFGDNTAQRELLARIRAYLAQ